MAMVGVDTSDRQAGSPPKSVGMVRLGAVLHSSNEPTELSQWLCHDKSIISTAMPITITTINTQTAQQY